MFSMCCLWLNDGALALPACALKYTLVLACPAWVGLLLLWPQKRLQGWA